MSQYRLNIFDECRDRTNPSLSEPLKNVTYHAKMTDKQLSALAEYMRQNGISFNSLLTYTGMDNIANDVLCRWLRPSELQRLSLIMNMGTLSIYRASLELQLKVPPGEFVGILGENLVRLTGNYNLLYAWYHNSNKTLVLYSLRKGDLKSAIQDPLIKEFKVRSIVEEQIGSANWGKVGQITNMRTYANAVRGVPATSTMNHASSQRTTRKTVLGRVPTRGAAPVAVARRSATKSTKAPKSRIKTFENAVKLSGIDKREKWADNVQQQQMEQKRLMKLKKKKM